MDETLLNDLQRTHFNFFWKLTNTANGLVPDGPARRTTKR